MIPKDVSQHGVAVLTIEVDITRFETFLQLHFFPIVDFFARI